MDADPDAIQAVDDLGRTPLHVAAQYGAALPIVQMLVKSCPDLTGEETNRGETALDLAKRHQGPPDVTSFLSEL
jgi:ankyrin repeat protein